MSPCRTLTQAQRRGSTKRQRMIPVRPLLARGVTLNQSEKHNTMVRWISQKPGLERHFSRLVEQSARVPVDRRVEPVSPGRDRFERGFRALRTERVTFDERSEHDR